MNVIRHVINAHGINCCYHPDTGLVWEQRSVDLWVWLADEDFNILQITKVNLLGHQWPCEKILRDVFSPTV